MTGVEQPKAALFFSRCKPWGVDLQRVAIKHNCVFFGHTLRRNGAPYVRDDPLSFMVSPAAPEDEWSQHHLVSTANRSIQTANRRLVRERVGPGSIVMVPRPMEGVIYCANVRGDFRVSFDEARCADAEAIFRQSTTLRDKGETCETIYASGEIAQGWDIEPPWTALPVPMVPAWIRRSLFGRSTYGVISGGNDPPDEPVAVIAGLIERKLSGLGFSEHRPTLDREQVKRRLIDTVTPSLFESLVVSLLQLEEPHRAWVGVGGSGDGGVDGVAADDDGDVVAVLQCKWAWDGKDVFGEETVWSAGRKQIARYLAYFSKSGPALPADVAIIDLDTITDLVLKHRARLPFATTIRVGEP